MNDYSVNNVSVYEKVTFPQVKTLIALLANIDLNSIENIERRFLEYQRNFPETLDFLSALKIVGVDEAHVIHGSYYQKIASVFDGNIEFPKTIIGMISETKNHYRDELIHYFKQYSITKNVPLYIPREDQRSKYSDIRNFLMELGAVYFNDSYKHYGINKDFIASFLATIKSNKKYSKSSLDKQLLAQDEIGMAAEEEILNYEKKRVGPENESNVIRIAEINVAAGYDIESITILEGDESVPRFIEVKAVPLNSYQFYWSLNEREIAKHFSEWYYLYLLPVENDGSFDINRMEIINNPINYFDEFHNEWLIESDVLKISMKY